VVHRAEGSLRLVSQRGQRIGRFQVQLEVGLQIEEDYLEP
jgi:hypothetical protein